VLLAGLLPFLCVTAAGLALRLTAVSAVEYNNFFLMMSQPTHVAPLGPPLPDQALALLVGVGLAVLALHGVMPLDARRRKERLRSALVADLAGLADLGSATRLGPWQARTLSRGLRLLAGSDPRDAARDAAGVLAALELGRLVDGLRQDFRAGTDPASEILRPAFRALGRLDRAPAGARTALGPAAAALRRLPAQGTFAAALGGIDALLARHPVFFALPPQPASPDGSSPPGSVAAECSD
jgi:hypothetical protein